MKRISVLLCILFYTCSCFSFEALSNFCEGQVYVMVSNQNSSKLIYTCQSINNVTNEIITSILEFDGSNTTILSDNIEGVVNCIVSNDSSIYIGGTIKGINNIPINGIGYFNGTIWQTLPANDGVDNLIIYSMCLYNNKLIVGGKSLINNNSIFTWDGQNWNNFPYFLNNTVFLLSNIDSLLYISGDFSFVNLNESNGTIIFDGTNWNNFSDSVEGHFTDIKFISNSLYFAGPFISCDSLGCSSFFTKEINSRLDPSIEGPNGPIFQMLSFDNKIYLIGYFDQLSDSSMAKNICTYDGTNFESILFPEGVQIKAIYSIVRLFNDIYISGEFLNPQQEVFSLAKLNIMN